MYLSEQQFKTLYPYCKNPKDVLKSIMYLAPIYSINTPKRIAAFIAQCGHESAGFRVYEENLNYSEKALDALFGKYFKHLNTKEYARNPQKIANIIYMNRMGNTKSNDGWKYRGRGAIQLTGSNNYKQFSIDTGINAYQNPDIILESLDNKLRTATWFWDKNHLNSYADKNDIKGMTKRINGGYFGLAERTEKYQEISEMLGHTTVIDNSVYEEENSNCDELVGFLRIGSRGEQVKLIQRELNLTPDGIFGKGTERAVKVYQKEHNLYIDGVIGPKTFQELIG